MGYTVSKVSRQGTIDLHERMTYMSRHDRTGDLPGASFSLDVGVFFLLVSSMHILTGDPGCTVVFGAFYPVGFLASLFDISGIFGPPGFSPISILFYDRFGRLGSRDQELSTLLSG